MAENNESYASSQVMDDAALATFPTRVVFRGNNARFLRVWNYHSSRIVRFDSQPGSRDAQFEIHPAGNGMVRIKSTYTGTFWRCNAQLTNYVHLTGGNIIEPDTLFQLVKVQVGYLNSYAIKSVQLNRYLIRFTGASTGLYDVMRATPSTIVDDAIVQIYDINNLNYEELTQQDKEAQPN